MVILLAARVFAELAARAGMPPVIGELFAGVLLGPTWLGWLEVTDIIRFLAEIGIILLLFKVGLEADLSRLVQSGSKAVGVALTGFCLPFALSFFLTFVVFSQSLLIALFVGGTLTATSIGITVRVLSDLRRQQSAEGQIVLGAAVVDDILGVVLLALLYESSAGGVVSFVNAGKVMFFIATFFVLAPFAARLIATAIRHFDSASQVPGIIPTTVVSLVLLFAWLAHAVGAPELLGGFAAGLALSRRFFLPMGLAMRVDPGFTERLSTQMQPIVYLFTPIFFVVVGLSLNLRAIDWGSPFIWAFSLSLLAAAVLGKLAAAIWLREARLVRVVIGAAMVPRGEVGLVFAELGRGTGAIPNETYAALVIVIALTTLLSPLALKWLYVRYRTQLEIETVQGSG